VIYAIGALVGWLSPAALAASPLLALGPLLLAFVGLFVLIVLRLTAGREAMARVWLAGRNWRYWLIFGVGFVVYYVVQAALNAAFGLGGATLAPLPAPPGVNPMSS
jgi:hypothetical protein